MIRQEIDAFCSVLVRIFGTSVSENRPKKHQITRRHHCWFGTSPSELPVPAVQLARELGLGKDKTEELLDFVGIAPRMFTREQPFDLVVHDRPIDSWAPRYMTLIGFRRHSEQQAGVGRTDAQIWWTAQELNQEPARADTLSVRNDSWPLRRSDALFVVAVVLLALPDPGSGWSFGIPSTATKVLLMVAAVLVWIRFRVFGRGDQCNR